MTNLTPETELDQRYGEITEPFPWPKARDLLVHAELCWLSTVRPDGRPHVTPLPAVWRDGAPHICTGPGERKARNLTGNPHCVLTTGKNEHWTGVDVVLEGTARRITEDATLRDLAAAWIEKFGSFWTFEVADGLFHHQRGGEGALVFRIDPVTAFAFTKGHGNFGQTRYRFASLAAVPAIAVSAENR